MNKLISFLLLCVTVLSQAFAQSGTTLTVTVAEIHALKGDIHAAVFSAGHDFPNGQDFLQAQHRAVSGEEVTLSFSLPPGTYAVSVYQDLDGDQKHDKNLLGIPTEPFCFSENYRPRLSSPDFADCAFTLPAEGQTIRLQLID